MTLAGFPSNPPLSLDGAFLDLLPAAVYACDVAGVIHYFNRRAVELWGRTPRCGDTDQRFCGSLRLFYPDGTHMAHASTPMAHALRTGLSQRNQEAIIERPDGSRITVMVNIDVLRDDTGAIIGAVNVLQDITDRQRAERQRAVQLGIAQLLAQAADFNEVVPALLQTTCEHLDWGVGLLWLVDPLANVLRCIEVWHRPAMQLPAFIKASRQRTFASGVGLPGRVWTSGTPVWLPNAITDTNFPRAPIAAQEGLHSGFACPIRLGQEILGVMEFFSTAIRPPDTALLEMMAGIGNQIGQFLNRTRAEAQLQRSEQELADFFNNAALALHWVGPDGTILRVNEAELRLLGYTREEYVGHHIARFHADQHVINDILQRLQAGEEIHDYEARLVCQDGSIKHVLIDSNVQWEHGRFRHTRCFTRDITAQKYAEGALRTSEAQLRAVLDYAPVFLARCDKDRHFTFANQGYAQRLGLKPADLIGKHVAEGLGAEAYASFRQYVDQVLAGEPVKFEVDVPYARLGRRFMHCAYVPDRDSSGQVQGWIAVITDITARRQAEEQLREQTRIAETLNRIGTVLAAELDLQRILQVVTDETTQLTEAEFGAFFYNVAHPQEESSTLYTLSGASREAFTAFPRSRNTAIFGPPFRGEAVVRLDDVQQDPRYGKNAPYFAMPSGHPPVRSYLAVPVISRSGEILGGLFLGHSRAGVFTAPHEQLVVGIAAQAAIAIERKRDEEALRHLTDTLAQRVAERTVELSRANAALQEEIEQHKHAREQLERHQEALAQREKLAAMGSMLANVAHELNNPLGVVMMQADMLREEAGTGPLAIHAAELTQAAERCVEIVHNFLSLARQYPPKRTRVALNSLIETAMKLLAYPLRVDTITVEHHLATDLPVLWADPHQLQQVVINLVTNAHQALRETTGARQLTLTTRTNQAQQRVVLEVADTGPGIPLHIQERLFEPFFTTKPPGVGTGLGLPFCLGIIEGHGGTIVIDSAPGRGTVVCVELPVEPLPADVTSHEPAGLPPVRGKTILIVDDEPGITRALTHLLRREGHTVETTANGRLALEKCQLQDYELILCDLRMPELDGPGFYKALQHRHPHLCQRIMFLTGDTLGPEAQEFLEHVGVPRLNKPFTVAMLRQAIQRF